MRLRIEHIFLVRYKVVLHTKCLHVFLWYSESHCPILEGCMGTDSETVGVKAKRVATGRIGGSYDFSALANVPMQVWHVCTYGIVRWKDWSNLQSIFSIDILWWAIALFKRGVWAQTVKQRGWRQRGLLQVDGLAAVTPFWHLLVYQCRCDVCVLKA